MTATAQQQTGTTVMTNVEAVRTTLHDALARDDRVLIMGEDVGARGNVFLITKGFLEEFGAQRVVDTPLAEASIVGVAIGMAMEGLRPIAEIQFADFIYPAFNQIVGEAAKTRYRTNGDYTCPLVIRTPYGGGVRGALSHSVSIEALFYHVPGTDDLGALDAGRHQGPAERRDRVPRPGAVPRAQEDVPQREGRGPRRLLHDPDRQGRREEGRHRRQRRVATATTCTRRSTRRTASRATASRSR